MSNYSNFVTDSSIKAKQEELSRARKLVLEKAKKKYEAEELKEKKKKERGEGTWMLDTVSNRIHKEQKTLEDTKSKGKKKKKKEKKRKKKKKKHHKYSDSSSSSTSSSENSDEETTWVESKTVSAPNVSHTSAKLQRDSWMELPLDMLPAISRQEIRDEANKEKQKAKMEAEKHLQPGQHARELNPYWKNGGSGLPGAQQSSSTPTPTAASSSSSSSSLSSGVSGDGGLSWMLKSLSRMKEQSKEEGRSLEDIAAERYGSLDRLMTMIHEAEKSHKSDRNRDTRDISRKDGGRRDYRDRYKDRENGKWGTRDAEREVGRDRQKERRSGESEEGRHSSRQDIDKRGDRSHSSRGSGFRRPDSDDEGADIYDRNKRDNKSSSSLSNRFRKPNSDEDDSNKDRYSRDENRRRSGFQRPSGSDDEDSRESRLSYSGNERKIFRKPDHDKDTDKRNYDSKTYKSGARGELDDRGKQYDRRDGKGWRKLSEESELPRWKRKDSSKLNQASDIEKRAKRTQRKSSSSESTSSSSDDEFQKRERKIESESDEEQESKPPAKIMSETELNDLAAKVLRAEIMGDENLASQLKATLEEARRLRESSKTGEGKGETDFVHSKSKERAGRKKDREEEQEEDNVVVLSRTNKAGMIRPVLPSSSASASAATEWGGRGAGGRKRKRKNVATHSESGERTKFFHDDDNFDLKTLVEREKAGTAEDQNSMFARLAGRETDRDLDVDDMFVSKAARGNEEEAAVNRDKMAAIMEHRKRSSAMEKCTRCFDKVPKHLIIAIGRKSYLCLPEHASLTEGHCLVVPMAHSSSATSMDEDVWQDIQQFRKSIVRMFLSQEKDVVFMETVMHLKHFPHTAIECIPMECEVGDLAPIYFKKAMQEVGPEWAQNKKVHDLSKTDVRHTIPKGFPYFSVDFGNQGGFAHAIEDEATFPGYFGREIVGGMLDTEPGLWRKPRKQNFEDQRQKVLQFEQWWSPFDWTQDIG